LGPQELLAARAACNNALLTLSWCGGGGGGGAGPALLDLGLSPYRTDLDQLASVRPDVILTQLQGLGPELTSEHYTAALEELLGCRPVVVHMGSRDDMAGVWSDMRAVAAALRLGEQGEKVVRGGGMARGV
ncbi:hypothetical protein Agub_g4307, partial [Astrephomene gubernaculifera]